VAQPAGSGHPSVNVTVPVDGEPDGPNGIVKVSVVVQRVLGAGAMTAATRKSYEQFRFEETKYEDRKAEGLLT
jgi:hypothetical protein